ncbi:MAG: ImmA/IrrE family metallo-endopeptidase [Planctomycetota bacterium]
MDLRRRTSSPKGSYPPNPKQWGPETHGINLRLSFDVASDSVLRPLDLEVPNTTLLHGRSEIEAYVDADFCEKLFGPLRTKWSGMTVPCDGHFVVLLNGSHSPRRNAVTLMEEYFHILLNHKPTVIKVCELTGILIREFDRSKEDEAYSSAAASLVPYRKLKSLVTKGHRVQQIADFFEVSSDLIQFRLKTCKLYRKAG